MNIIISIQKERNLPVRKKCLVLKGGGIFTSKPIKNFFYLQQRFEIVSLKAAFRFCGTTEIIRVTFSAKDAQQEELGPIDITYEFSRKKGSFTFEQTGYYPNVDNWFVSITESTEDATEIMLIENAEKYLEELKNLVKLPTDDTEIMLNEMAENYFEELG